MKPSSAKAKGRNLQKWIRDLLLINHPNLTLDDIRSTGMGQSGVDIQLSAAAKQQIPFAIECKNVAKIAVYKWMEQAEANSDGLTPIVVMKQNRSRPMVLIDAERFFEIWKEHEDRRSN